MHHVPRPRRCRHPRRPPKITGLSDLASISRFITGGGAQMPPMAAMLTADGIDDVAKFVAANLPAE
jgi:mono/diheme cytochrome c family protein